MVMVMAVAVPALSGVFAQRKAEESFGEFEVCVAEARARSMAEGRAYVVIWTKTGAEVRLDGADADAAENEPAAQFHLEKGETLALELPAAMRPKPASVWTFWPNGSCEPATVRFAGADGNWVARYNPLTTRAEVEYE